MYLEGVTFQMLGFDARRMDTNWREQRSGCRWDSFLLRTDIERPLSTDDAVWDFALNWDDPNVVMPDWTGPYQYLWENLADLEQTLREQESLVARPYWVIAVARGRNSSTEESTLGTFFEYDQISPGLPSENWAFLGYDVSDYFQLSGLMNCGYGSSDLDRMPYFASKLNSYHLFDSFSVAEECREWMDGRVEEHAPFFVYALFRIREDG